MSFHPQSAHFVQASNIPAELKAIPQWVVWRAINKTMPDGSTKVTKPPYRSSDPAREASVTDSTTWSTFEDAVACWIDNPSAVAGIGYVFTQHDDYFGIDVDTWRKILEEHRAERQEEVNKLLETVVSYTETSPSGEGLHIICRGRMPIAGKANPRMGVEMYCWNRFFTFTGNVWRDRGTITNQQAWLDRLPWETAAVSDTGDLPEYRRMDLPDAEVVRMASNANPSFAPRFNGTGGCEAGEWSDSFMAVVGGLDRITGSAEQIERIVKSSAMVLHVGPAGNNETRVAKANRVFPGVLSYVRGTNTVQLSFVEHGRQVWESIERTKVERAQELMQHLIEAEEKLSNLSGDAASLLEAFPDLTFEHKVLTRPPGVVGRFVKATEKACGLPFTAYAIPATLTALSGIVGRQFKLPTGSGLNFNVILTGPSATGKTQSMKAWESFIGQANEGLPATPAGPPRTRIINSSTSSIQAMMPVLMERPSCVWFVEECDEQLKTMSNSRIANGPPLRDGYNRLYDCSSANSTFEAPRSIAGSKANFTPIPNLNVSTYWTTTPDKFELAGRDVMDGFLSRVVPIRITGRTGNLSNTVSPKLDLDLLAGLRDRMAMATMLDAAYAANMAPETRLTTINVPDEVEKLLWTFRLATQAIKEDANDPVHDRPSNYTAVSRLPDTAMRIAGTLAVMESPNAPCVTQVQLKWSFGWLLQNLVGLLSDIDNGIVGDNARDDFKVARRVFSNLLKLPVNKSLGGVGKDDFRRALSDVNPFKQEKSASQAANTVRDKMIAEGLFETKTVETGGRPKFILFATARPDFWKRT